MAIALNGHAYNSGSNTILISATSIGAGDTLVLCCGSVFAGSSWVITDPNNTWSSAVTTNTTSLTTAIFVLTNAVAGSYTITATTSPTGHNCWGFLYDLSGAGAADVFASNNGSGTSNLSSGTTGSVAVSNEACLAVFASSASRTFTAGGSYTLHPDAPATNFAESEYLLGAGTGTQTANITTSSNTTYSGSIVTILPTGAQQVLVPPFTLYGLQPYLAQ